MRTVIDTNVLLSGLLWRGAPHRLIEAVRVGALAFITSPALLAELGEVIHRPKFHTILVRSRTDPEEMLGELRRLAEIIDPPPLPAQVSRDPDDDAVLAPRLNGPGPSPPERHGRSSSCGRRGRRSY